MIPLLNSTYGNFISLMKFNCRYTLDNLPAQIRGEMYFFNTFFWTNLTRKNRAGSPTAVEQLMLICRKLGHENVKKWTSKVDLFSKKYIVIPINEEYVLPLIEGVGLMVVHIGVLR